VILERLEITGFGSLHDISEDLHPRVTVIAGRNESGKSTLLRAVRAALYGIDAGGQGRPVERSDWARYEPWTRGGYGLALTYKLDDGRRIRVARRLDTREQSVQVLELGGSELTDELRSGRAVTPGRFHLGIDEAVFCATAWLGDDGLRIDAPEGARQRAGQLQEAIERLADTRRGVTAAQAMARLRDAMERVGSERRVTSPLGVATSRLKALDRLLDEARTRLAAVALDQERLADLEAALAVETERWIHAERTRLGARLADTADRRARLIDLVREAKLQSAALEANTPYARFPIDAETEVTALGGELAQARTAAADAKSRWDMAADRLRPIRARREEIARGIAAIGAPAGASGTEIGERAQRLRGELFAAASTVRRETGDDAREAALRREIAATGLRGLPARVIDDLLPQLEQAGRGGLRFGTATVLIAIVTVATALVLSRGHSAAATAIAIGVGAAAAAACAWRAWTRTRAASTARATARQLALDAGADPSEVERLAGRLPVLRALHAALDDTEHRTSLRRADAEAAQEAVASLIVRCQALAVEAGVAQPLPRQPATVDAAMLIAGQILDRVDATVLRARRRDELVAEEAVLAADDAASGQLREDVDRSARNVTALESRLRTMLDQAGIPVAGDLAVAVAEFRHGCEARRGYDEARRRLADLQRSARSLGGDGAALASLEADLTEQLRQRGGDPASALASPPPDAAALQQMDLDAERARRAATSASDQARELRARLGGVLDTLPVIADLEDERDSCAAARERGLRQLKALRVASDMIEAASRVTHRELAPRLAASLGNRLSLLTGARYVDVNVDTDHFALGLLGRTRPDMVPLDAVSHGTRDQVALLLRLSLCEVLGGAGERAPLLLDEPLLTSDPARRDLLIEFLHDVSATHQVLISTADPAMIEAVSRVTLGDCAVIRLDDPVAVDLEGSANAVGRHSARMRLLSSQG
jgi:DNA repair protein SbcC/Rad50